MILDCERFSNNHSEEVVRIYVGTATPLVMCGYHSSPLGNNLVEKVIKKINEEKK
jgi:hypothetical protein